MSCHLLRLTHTATVEEFREDFEQLMAGHPESLPWASTPEGLAEAIEVLKEAVPYLWLGKEDDKPVAALYMELVLGDNGENLAEIHGISAVGETKNPVKEALLVSAINYMFNTAFVVAIIAHFDSQNKGAKGFCLKNGFTLVTTDEGLRYWYLDKERFEKIRDRFERVGQ